MLRPLLVVAALASPAAAANTVQQDFDAAQALFEAGKLIESRDAFSALYARFPPNAQGKPVAIVRAQLGAVMIATGDTEKAEALIAAAVDGFKASKPADIEERGLMQYDLGRAREALGKIDSAAESYRAALASGGLAPGSASEAGARTALARTLIWSDPAEARRLLDALLASPPPAAAADAADQLATLRMLRGRVELNDSKPAEAERWLSLAARAAGGANTTKVSVIDLLVRGDMVVASYLRGNMAEVRSRVYYAGAAQLDQMGLTTAAAMPLPECAPVSGIAPDALAVIEFTIGDDGRVTSVTPIYASRGPDAGADAPDNGPEALFSQAVRNWYWNATDVKRLDPFWRQAIRVELRCLTDRASSDPIARTFDTDYYRWLSAKGLPAMTEPPANAAEALPLIRAEIARREAATGAQSPQLIPPLTWLAANVVAPGPDRAAAAVRRLALMVAAGAPATVIGRARLDDIAWAKATSRAQTRVVDDRNALRILLADASAVGSTDSRINMFARLRLAEAEDELGNTQASRDLLDRIVAMPASSLGDADPIRTAALLRLSSQALAAKDTQRAADAVAATGLSAEQCAIVDVRPLGLKNYFTDADYPQDARKMNTAGFVQIGYDITASGVPANIRTVIGSPPFIFGPSTEAVITRFRFRPVFRPANVLGCTGFKQQVRYRLMRAR